MVKKVKRGDVYTPNWFVPRFLELAGYYGKKILKKHFMDNSCGEGRLLIHAMHQYVSVAACEGMNVEEIEHDLCTYFHGIDIDRLAVQNAIRNINTRVGFPVGEDVITWEDALETEFYDGRMDYVVCNPPYIRDRNLTQTSHRNFNFCQQGNQDLYLAFFEKGLQMLAPNGTLAYLTPEYWCVNNNAKAFREYVHDRSILTKYAILSGKQPMWPSVSVQVSVTVLKNGPVKYDRVDVYEFDIDTKDVKGIEHKTYDECWIDGKFYPYADENLREIFGTTYHKVNVKYGFCTNNDKFFIKDRDEIPEEYRLPIVHANTGRKEYMFFPYKDGKLVAYVETDSDLHKFLIRHKDEVSPLYGWRFGRSQGIGDVYKDKVTISYMMPEDKEPIISSAPVGVGVNAGMYVLGMDTDNVRDLMCTDTFRRYIRSVGSRRESGWISYTGKDIEKYLNWCVSKQEEV